MTPEELAAIRADYWDVDMRLRALCDALEQAWAERDQSEALFREQAIAHVREHERAERAETLAAELLRDVATEQAMTDKAERALARVRGLCDTDDCYADWSWGDLARAMTDIRAAIEVQES